MYKNGNWLCVKIYSLFLLSNSRQSCVLHFHFCVFCFKKKTQCLKFDVNKISILQKSASFKYFPISCAHCCWICFMPSRLCAYLYLRSIHIHWAINREIFNVRNCCCRCFFYRFHLGFLFSICSLVKCQMWMSTVYIKG